MRCGALSTLDSSLTCLQQEIQRLLNQVMPSLTVILSQATHISSDCLPTPNLACEKISACGKLSSIGTCSGCQRGCAPGNIWRRGRAGCFWRHAGRCWRGCVRFSSSSRGALASSMVFLHVRGAHQYFSCYAQFCGQVFVCVCLCCS